VTAVLSDLAFICFDIIAVYRGMITVAVLGVTGVCEPGSTVAPIVVDEIHAVAERIARIRLTFIHLCIYTQRPHTTATSGTYTLRTTSTECDTYSIRVSVDMLLK